jgi:ATP-dependent Lon protease
MENKVIQVRIHKQNEVKFIEQIKTRKKELGIKTDSAYLLFLLKQDVCVKSAKSLYEKYFYNKVTDELSQLSYVDLPKLNE